MLETDTRYGWRSVDYEEENRMGLKKDSRIQMKATFCGDRDQCA
jgi:hypothetical protein